MLMVYYMNNLLVKYYTNVCIYILMNYYMHAYVEFNMMII